MFKVNLFGYYVWLKYWVISFYCIVGIVGFLGFKRVYFFVGEWDLWNKVNDLRVLEFFERLFLIFYLILRG